MAPDRAGHRSPTRRGAAGLGLAALAILGPAVLAGCSGSEQGATVASAVPVAVAVVEPAAAPATAAPVTTAAPVETTPATPPPTVPIDAAAMLVQSLDAVVGGYHFRTSVTVAGVEVLVSEGDRVGNGTRLTIWTGGTSLSYLITPAGAWVVPDGGEWQALDTPPATTDPLAALRVPTAVSGTSYDGVAATIVASVPAAALGVPSDGTADVQITVNGPTLQQVRYSATIDGRTADVTTVFGPIVDPSPVVAPI
jgi:hypothetical protein